VASLPFASRPAGAVTSLFPPTTPATVSLSAQGVNYRHVAVYFHHKFDHEFEDSPPPVLSFVVCSLPRSGSSLLCDVLASTELAGAPSEYFDADQMAEFGRAWGVTTFEQYLTALVAKKTSPNGVFGVKAHYHQLFDAFPGGDLGEAFPNVHHVYITRADRVRQAVSFAIATQTEKWSSLQEANGAQAVYSAAEIDSFVEWIEREEAAWERYLAKSGAPVCRIVYEDLVAGLEGAVLEVMRFLGIELPAGFEVPAPTLARQAGALNDDWVARYRARERA
jgi:LPS sulfotransferase NodH